jgi:hypothetical protein
VLDEHEQRVLEELERSLAAEAREPVRAGRPTRPRARWQHWPPGGGPVALLGVVSLLLLVAGVPLAALAIALATALGWLLWWLAEEER